MQNAEHLLVVDDVGGETADQANLMGEVRLNQGLAFVPMLQKVACHGAAPDDVDIDIAITPCGVLAMQVLAVKRQFAHVEDGDVESAFLEDVRVHLELLECGVLKEVDDGDARFLDFCVVVAVDGEERVNPAREQVGIAVRKRMILRKATIRLALRDAGERFAVLVHARGAVGVELAKAQLASVLVKEAVDARDRQRVGVASWGKHQLLKALIELEECAIFRV